MKNKQLKTILSELLLDKMEDAKVVFEKNETNTWEYHNAVEDYEDAERLYNEIIKGEKLATPKIVDCGEIDYMMEALRIETRIVNCEEFDYVVETLAHDEVSTEEYHALWQRLKADNAPKILQVLAYECWNIADYYEPTKKEIK